MKIALLDINAKNLGLIQKANVINKLTFQILKQGNFLPYIGQVIYDLYTSFKI